MKKLALILVLLFASTAANAQCNGVFGASQTCGSVSGGPPGPIPFSAINVPGGTNGQTQYNNNGAFGGYTPNGDITVNPSTGLETITPGAANTFKGTLNGTVTTDIPLVACSAIYQLTKWVSGTGWQCSNQYVLPSRTIAASLNLSAFIAIETLGYSSQGDGGGAPLVKLSPGSTFQDQTLATGHISNAGSGYTAGTYNGIPLGGGSGTGCTAQLIAAGGVITTVNFSISCNGYKAGDVISAPAFGGGSGFQYTVDTINPALGSFTDTSSNLWQITTGQGVWPNVLQFGAKGDWAGTDGTATNNRSAFISAIAFAVGNQSNGSTNLFSNKLIIPHGAFMLCGTGATPSLGAIVNIPQGMILEGSGFWGGTTIQVCAAESVSEHIFTLCDPNAFVGQFGCQATNFYVNARATAGANNNIAVFYGTSGAQFNQLRFVGINAGTRSCFFYDHGYGGAANVITTDVECLQDNTATNPAVVYGSNLGTTNAVMRDWVIECTAAPCGSYAVSVLGSPYIMFDENHFEGRNNGYNIQSTSGATAVVRNQYIGGPCALGMNISVGNPANSVMLENFQSACTVTVSPRGGANITGTILAQRVI